MDRISGLLAQRADEFMSVALVTVAPTDSLERAHSAMRYAATHHLPVVSEGKRLVGILSDRDFPGGRARRGLKVADCMKHRVQTVRAEDCLGDVVARMVDCDVHAIPVVDRARHLQGIITDRDILRFLALQFLRPQERLLAAQ
jgi:CBS domain-containing protein